MRMKSLCSHSIYPSPGLFSPRYIWTQRTWTKSRKLFVKSVSSKHTMCIIVIDMPSSNTCKKYIMEHTVNGFRSLYESDALNSTYSVHQILRKLQNTICNLVERACEAQATCEELCPVNASFSTRDVLEPIRRMYTHPEVITPGTRAVWESIMTFHDRKRRETIALWPFLRTNQIFIHVMYHIWSFNWFEGWGKWM